MFLRPTTHFTTANAADAPPPGGGAPQGTNGAAPPNGPGTSPGAPTVGTPPAGPLVDASTISMPSDAFKQRLADEGAKAERKFLKAHGFDTPEAFKARLDAAKKLEDAQKTEHEKLTARVKELEPHEQRASTLSKRFESVVATEFAKLSEKQQAAVDKFAEGDAEKRWERIELLREAGALDAAAPAAPTVPATPPSPRTTAPAGGPPPTPGGGQKTAYEEYVAKSANPILGPLFYQNNAAEIERTRPSGA